MHIGRESDLFGGGACLGCPEHFGDHLHQREALRLDRQFPRLHLHRLQQIPNHGPQLLGIAQGHPESIALPWREFALPAVEEIPRIPQNRHQRRAKFVRHVGEQVIFHL